MFFPSRRGTGMMLTSTSRRALGSTAKDGSLRRPRETHYLASREPGGGRKSRACDRRRRSSMTEIPTWHITGDWFDNCSCAVACPCTFAQAPDNGFCESVLFWHIQRGHYGDINLDGLSFVRVGKWEGDLWAGKAKGSAGIFIDERADERQAEVLPLIFGGRAGGFPGFVATLF